MARLTDKNKMQRIADLHSFLKENNFSIQQNTERNLPKNLPKPSETNKKKLYARMRTKTKQGLCNALHGILINDLKQFSGSQTKALKEKDTCDLQDIVNIVAFLEMIEYPNIEPLKNALRAIENKPHADEGAVYELRDTYGLLQREVTKYCVALAVKAEKGMHDFFGG